MRALESDMSEFLIERVECWKARSDSTWRLLFPLVLHFLLYFKMAPSVAVSVSFTPNDSASSRRRDWEIPAFSHRPFDFINTSGPSTLLQGAGLGVGVNQKLGIGYSGLGRGSIEFDEFQHLLISSIFTRLPYLLS